MQRYQNINGDSGIESFEIGDDFIGVRFNDQDVYLYTYKSAGSDNIEQMKKLAQNGRVLCSFINQYVKKHYVLKER